MKIGEAVSKLTENNGITSKKELNTWLIIKANKTDNKKEENAEYEFCELLITCHEDNYNIEEKRITGTPWHPAISELMAEDYEVIELQEGLDINS